MARVLVISPNPLAISGGVERFCADIAAVSHSEGHEVRVIGPHRQTGRWAMRLGLKALIESWSVPLRLADWEPDVVVTNGFLGGRRRRGTQVIHIFHGTMAGSARVVRSGEPLRQRLRAGLGGGIAELLAARGSINVAVSDSAAGEAQRYYGSKIEAVIPNGVDTSLFRRRPRPAARDEFGLEQTARLALFVGRAEHRKAPEVALESCRRAGFELLVAGPSTIPGAQHLGVVEPARLATLYAACDCVVFPTRYEACSYVVLEALASGVPLVTTEVGWMKTFLRHVPEYRLLVGRPEPSELADILGRLDEPGVLAAVDAAYDWVREHNSIEMFAAQWRTLIGSVLGDSLSVDERHPSVRTIQGVR
jgi:glycosyltransferase involved in cell wall biosynthesis